MLCDLSHSASKAAFLRWPLKRGSPAHLELVRSPATWPPLKHAVSPRALSLPLSQVPMPGFPGTAGITRRHALQGTPEILSRCPPSLPFQAPKASLSLTSCGTQALLSPTCPGPFLGTYIRTCNVGELRGGHPPKLWGPGVVGDLWA